MRNLETILLLSLLCILAPCGKAQPTASSTEQQPTPVVIDQLNNEAWPDETYRSVLPIDSTIVWSLREGHYYGRPSTPFIKLSQFTDHEYWAYNLSIIQEIETSPGEIVIQHGGIHRPWTELDALGPARWLTYLEMAEGVYTLQFKYDGLIDIYEIKIDDESIRIFPIEASYTRPGSLLYWRYPTNSFAFYCGTTIETSYLCDEFIDLLFEELTLDEIFFPDSGVAAYSRVSMGHYYDAAAIFFVYKSENDFLRAGNLLREFTSSSIGRKKGIGMRLVNWRAEQYLSWMLSIGK